MTIQDSTPSPKFPAEVWDGTTPHITDVHIRKTPDVLFGERYRAEIQSLEEVLLSYLDLLDKIKNYGPGNSLLTVKGDGTELEYKSLVEGTGITIVHSAGSITISSTGGTGVDIVDLENAEASTIYKGTPVYIYGNDQVKKAQADNLATVEAIGLVYDSSIAASATGSIVTDGIIEATTGEWDTVTGGSGGLTAGAIYYLDPDTAGMLTTTAPTTVGDYVLRVGTALSTTEFEISILQPILL